MYLPVSFFISFIMTLIIRDKILNMIANSGFVRPNYKGEDIPLSSGITFFLATLISILPLFFFWPANMRDPALIFLFAMAAATFLGLMDDFWGTREASGLAGHFKALMKGNLTTGAVKALAGGFLALILGMHLHPGDIIKTIVSALIIALSVNLINLFDLRPGRAGKVYILLYIIMLPAFWGKPESLMATLVLGCLAAFLPADVKARTMMGDAGANTLGIVIGITAAATLKGYYSTSYLLFLIFMHILTEKYSLTRIISRNALLNYLDMLGREKEPQK